MTIRAVFPQPFPRAQKSAEKRKNAAGAFPDRRPLNIVEEEKPDVVTEEMVEKYYSMGYRQIPAAKHAVVTPLAREKAKELDIQILV